MAADLLIKSGTVIDGSGGPCYRADVAVTGGRIVEIGRIRKPAAETIDCRRSDRRSRLGYRENRLRSDLSSASGVMSSRYREPRDFVNRRRIEEVVLSLFEASSVSRGERPCPRGGSCRRARRLPVDGARSG